MNLLRSALAIVMLAFPAFAYVGWTQADQSPNHAPVDGSDLRFSVVSIRQNKAGGQQVLGRVTPDGWEMRNMFLLGPILTAYVPLAGGAKTYADDQVVGMPPWLVSDDARFDIDARMDESNLNDWQDPDKQSAMLRTMLQTMLADRLHLRVHRTTKEAPVYALEVSDRGARLKETDPGAAHPGTYPMPGGGMLSMETKDGWMTTHYFGVSVGQLMSFLLGTANRPVVDKTGLAGKYDLTIVKPAPSVVGASTVNSASEMSAAEIVGQLGLRLKPQQGPVETLVIDHVERPSSN
jgi:bla regulator protein blaR1